VYLVFTGGSGYLLNLNWLQFKRAPVGVCREAPTARISVTALAGERRLAIYDGLGRRLAAGSGANVDAFMKSRRIEVPRGVYFVKISGGHSAVPTRIIRIF
jgi:hypothetical protein